MKATIRTYGQYDIATIMFSRITSIPALTASVQAAAPDTTR